MSYNKKMKMISNGKKPQCSKDEIVNGVDGVNGVNDSSYMRRMRTRIKNNYLNNHLIKKPMDTIQAQLKELEAQLYHREEEVIGQGDQLQNQIDVQDVKISKIREAYKAMGLINEAQIMGIIVQFADQHFNLPEPESFWEKYGEIDHQLNQSLSLLASQNKQKEPICQAEKVVVDLMTVLKSYWDKMASSLKIVCDLLSVCKYSEYQTILGIEDWEARQKDHSMSISVRDRLMTERMEYINDQLGLLSKEEVILQEMQLICNERERIYWISRKLFLR